MFLQYRVSDKKPNGMVVEKATEDQWWEVPLAILCIIGIGVVIIVLLFTTIFTIMEWVYGHQETLWESIKATVDFFRKLRLW